MVPGAGQLYCGATTRGIATLLSFPVAILPFFLVPPEARWIVLQMAFALYAFAGVDAYATALEMHRGIDPEAPENPRVAAILNLTTNGYGYVYIGWKVGFATFLLMAGFWDSVGRFLPLLGQLVAYGLAAHAYIGGRDARRDVYPEPPSEALESSSVPAVLPWTVSGIVLVVNLVLTLVGQIAILRGFH
jgi:hypothetical protein